MRALKLTTLIVAGAVLALVMAAGVFIATFDPNSYRELLAKSIAKATDRNLTISGDLSLSVWPNIAFRAEDLTLSNPSQFSTSPMLEAAALEATIALAPLLSLSGPRDIQIDGLVLYKPTLYLIERTISGERTNNWDDLAKLARSQTHEHSSDSPEVPAEDQTNTATMIQLQSAEIIDGTLIFTADEQRQELGSLSSQISFLGADNSSPLASANVSIAGSWLGIDAAQASPFAAQTKVIFADSALKFANTTLTASDLPAPLPATVELQSNGASWGVEGARIQTLVGEISAISPLASGLKFGIDELTITADLDELRAPAIRVRLADNLPQTDWLLDLQATGLTKTPTAKGHVRAVDASMSRLVSATQVDLPEGITADQLGTVTLHSNFSLDVDGSLALEDASAQFPELELDTTAAIAIASSGHASGSLSVGALNVEKLAERLPGFIPTGIFADSAPGPLQLRDLTATFRWQPEPAQPSGASPRQPAGGRLSVENLTASGLGANYIISGYIDSNSARTNIEFATPSLKQVLTYFSTAYSPSDPDRLKTASGQLNVSQVQGQPLRVELPELSIDDASWTGWVSIADMPKPAIEFSLDVDQLNISDYLPQNPKAPNTRPAGRSSDSHDAPLGAQALPRALDLDYDFSGVIRFGVFQLFDLVLGDASTEVILNDRNISANAVKASVYGGALEGSFNLSQDSALNLPTLSIKADLREVALGELLVAAADQANLTGTGNLSMDLKGSGDSLLAATQSSSGRFSVSVAEGNFNGVDLGHSLCTLYNRLRGLPEPPPAERNSTPFDQFSATARVSDGEATTTDLLASNDYLRLSGTGRTRLARQSIKYDLDVELTGPIDAPSCESLTPFIGSRIPVRLSGTFADPVVRPDFAKLVRRQLRRRVEEKITDKLLDLFGGAPDEDQEAPEPTP